MNMHRIANIANDLPEMFFILYMIDAAIFIAMPLKAWQ